MRPYSDGLLDSKRIGAAGWRIVLLASLGGTLEYYDFVLFGIFLYGVLSTALEKRLSS